MSWLRRLLLDWGLLSLRCCPRCHQPFSDGTYYGVRVCMDCWTNYHVIYGADGSQHGLVDKEDMSDG